MQYEASYGSEFWVVIAVCAVIYVYTNLSFISNGHRLHVKHNGDIYKAYCGKYIGKFFDYFSALFCYMSFVVMCEVPILQLWSSGDCLMVLVQLYL